MFSLVLLTGNFDVIKSFGTRVGAPKVWASVRPNIFEHSLTRPWLGFSGAERVTQPNRPTLVSNPDASTIQTNTNTDHCLCAVFAGNKDYIKY